MIENEYLWILDCWPDKRHLNTATWVLKAFTHRGRDKKATWKYEILAWKYYIKTISLAAIYMNVPQKHKPEYVTAVSQPGEGSFLGCCRLSWQTTECRSESVWIERITLSPLQWSPTCVQSLCPQNQPSVSGCPDCLHQADWKQKSTDPKQSSCQFYVKKSKSVVFLNTWWWIICWYMNQYNDSLALFPRPPQRGSIPICLQNQSISTDTINEFKTHKVG